MLSHLGAVSFTNLFTTGQVYHLSSQVSPTGRMAQTQIFIPCEAVPDVWRMLYNKTPPAAYTPLVKRDSAAAPVYASSPEHKTVKMHSSYLITPSRANLPASASSAAALLLRQAEGSDSMMPPGTPSSRLRVDVPKVDELDDKDPLPSRFVQA